MGRSAPRLNFPYTGASRTPARTMAFSCQRSDRSSTVPTGGVWRRCWPIRSASEVWPERAPVTEASRPSHSLKSQPARSSRVPVRVRVSKTLMPTVAASENRPPTGYSLGWTGGSGLARARAGASSAASPARASTRKKDTWPAKLARDPAVANGRSAELPPERPMVVIGRPGNARVQTFTESGYFLACWARSATFTDGRTKTMPSLWPGTRALDQEQVLLGDRRRPRSGSGW